MQNKLIDMAAEMLKPIPPGGLADAKSYKFSEVGLEDDPAELPPEIVGELLRAGERAVLGSTSKSRKSWALLHLAICKAAGVPWLGWSMNPGKVLYIDFELMDPFFKRRARTISKALGLPHSENLTLWPLRNHKPKPNIKELVKETLRRYEIDGLELIILEPSYKLIQPTSQGTNSEMEVMAYLEALDELAYPLKCAVITSHHSPKGDLSGRNSIDLFSGTGVWARDPDLLMTMRPHVKDDHVIFDLTRRHGVPVDPSVLCWETPLHKLAYNEDPTKVRTKQSQQKAGNTDLVANTLKEAPEAGWRHCDWKRASEQAGVSSAAFDRHRKTLLEKDKVEILNDGSKVRYRLKTRAQVENPF